MSLHVQDAGDGVALSEGGQRAHQLAPVIEVAAVCAVQPHVSGGVVVVISHRPARHADARALVAPVLFGNVELRRRDQTLDIRQSEGRSACFSEKSGPHLPNEAAGGDGGGCQAVTFASRAVGEDVAALQGAADDLVRVEREISNRNTFVVAAWCLREEKKKISN